MTKSEIELMCEVVALRKKLKQTQKNVWNEAVELVSEYITSGGTTSPGQATLRKIATRCREKANKE
jgi:hypothetical protein